MNRVKRHLLVVLCAFVTLPCVARAQSNAWQTKHQMASWYAVTVDHAMTNKMSVWFDGQWRRMGVGSQPQQLLLRPGLQFALAAGVRVAAGYAYIATAPYGEAPTLTPLREHRMWHQLLLSHRAGPLSVSHRYRWEQRWISASTVDGEASASPRGQFYQQRVRYLTRVQGRLSRPGVDASPLLVFVSDEILLQVGHSDAHARFAQNRAAIGLGVPITERVRLELSYLNLWNALPSARINEVNHTISLSLGWTSAKRLN